MKKADELREKTIQELEDYLVNLSREGLMNRTNVALGQMEKKHLLRKQRRTVARVKTIIAQKRSVKENSSND